MKANDTSPAISSRSHAGMSTRCSWRSAMQTIVVMAEQGSRAICVGGRPARVRVFRLLRPLAERRRDLGDVGDRARAATPTTSAYTSSSGGSSSTPFLAQNTYVASQASRLLPSISGWFRLPASAGARPPSSSGLDMRPGPMTLARGRWTAASSRPMSRTGSGPPIARRAIVSACSVVRYRVTRRGVAAAPRTAPLHARRVVGELVVLCAHQVVVEGAERDLLHAATFLLGAPRSASVCSSLSRKVIAIPTTVSPWYLVRCAT